MRTRNGLSIFFCLAFGACDAGTADSSLADSGSPDVSCVSGATRACECAGGVSGTQQCAGEPAGWLACVCEDAEVEAGATDDPGSDQPEHDQPEEVGGADAGPDLPCVGPECEPPDCKVTGCPSGKVCVPQTGLCADGLPAVPDECAACSTAAQCPDGWTCDPLASGKGCLKPCATNDECQTGWSCQVGKCTPDGYRCDKCVTAGCGEGLVCDTITQVCKPPSALCEPCVYGWECGPDASCARVAETGGRVCRPRCGAASDCPDGRPCEVDPDSNVRVCASVSGACCYAEDPSACPPFEPICVGPTPYFADGKCVQCLSNAHCASGFCHAESHTCGPNEPACQLCGDAYPACAEVDGQFFCVPCTDDSYCLSGCTCDPQSYTCGGAGCDLGGPHCKADTDCSPGLTGFDLHCEVATGQCVDANGGCDDITAFCRQGASCVSFLGFGLGPPFALPPAGSTLPGGCACDLLIEAVSPPATKICGEGVCASLFPSFPGLPGTLPSHACLPSD